MKKYLIVISNTLQSSVAYRANWIVSIASFILPVLGLMYLWQAIFAAGGGIAGYTLSSLMTYFLLSRFLVQIIPTTVWREVGDNIKSGGLTQFLIRPINYVAYYFCSVLAIDLLYGLLAWVMTVLFALFFWSKIIVLTEPAYWLSFLVSILLGHCLGFFFGISLCLTAFWVEDIGGVQRIQGLIGTLLSGALIPLDLFPVEVAKLFGFLPYRYLLSFQIEIYLQRLALAEVGQGFAVMGIWILFFMGLSALLWRMGIRRYTAYGG